MMNQRQGVYTAVVKVLGHEPKEAVVLSSAQKEQVYSLLQHGFVNGEIELKGDRSPEWIRKYIPGLVNNWVRKDPKLNGDTKYIAKNPGSRTGSGDDQLKAMKALRTMVTDPVQLAEIDKAIEERKAELMPKKEVDLSVLPENLRHLVPTSAVAPIVRKAS